MFYCCWFELANHVLVYYKSRSSSVLSASSQEFHVDISEREVVVVVYIAGYVFGQLYRRIRKSRLRESDLCQQKLSLLKADKIEAVETDDRYKLVKCRDRGGLWYVSVDVIGIFTETEKDFKLQTQNMAVIIDFKKIVKNVVTIAYVQSCIANIEAILDIPLLITKLCNIFLNRLSCSMYVFEYILSQMMKFKVSKVLRFTQKLYWGQRIHFVISPVPIHLLTSFLL